MALILQKGRPADMTGREAREVRTYDLLDKLKIEYERIDHARAMTMEVCEEIDAALGCIICKNLFLTNRQQTDFYLLLICGDKPFRTSEVSKKLGISRLSFATPEHMRDMLDILPGSVSVLGLMNDKEKKVKLVVDSELLSAEYFGCHPCENTSSLKLRTEDIFNNFLPAVGYDYVAIEI